MGNQNSLFVQLERPSYYVGEPMVGNVYLVLTKEVHAKAILLQINGGVHVNFIVSGISAQQEISRLHAHAYAWVFAKCAYRHRKLQVGGVQ